MVSGTAAAGLFQNPLAACMAASWNLVPAEERQQIERSEAVRQYGGLVPSYSSSWTVRFFLQSNPSEPLAFGCVVSVDDKLSVMKLPEVN
jgi:hypothetical protein